MYTFVFLCSLAPHLSHLYTFVLLAAPPPKDILNFSPATFRLMSLTLQVVFFSHIAGCMFFLVSGNQENVNNTEERDKWWYIDWGGRNLKDEHIGDKYLASIYWAVTTMTTVGYGDLGTCLTVLTSVKQCYTVLTVAPRHVMCWGGLLCVTWCVSDGCFYFCGWFCVFLFFVG